MTGVAPTEDKSIAAFIDAAIALGDQELDVRCLREVALARDIPELVEHLTNTPTFDSILRVVGGLNLRLGVRRRGLRWYRIDELLAGCDFSILLSPEAKAENIGISRSRDS